YAGRVLPIFRLSRFPVGDYRVFFCLGVLVAALSGLERVWSTPQKAAGNTVRLLTILTVAILLVAALFHFRPPSFGLGFAGEVGLCMAVITIWPIVAGNRRLRSAWPGCIIAAAVATMIATLYPMKPFWNDRDVETDLYDRFQLPLQGNDGSLRIHDVFR